MNILNCPARFNIQVLKNGLKCNIWLLHAVVKTPLEFAKAQSP